MTIKNINKTINDKKILIKQLLTNITKCHSWKHS